MTVRGRRVVGGVVALLSAALVAGGAASFRAQESEILSGRQEELRVIGEAKVAEIASWRGERLADLRREADALTLFLVRQGALSAEAGPWREMLRQRLVSLKEAHGYGDVLLAAPDGTLLMAVTPRTDNLRQETGDLLDRAAAAREPVLGSLFRCPRCGEIHLDAAVALRDEAGAVVAFLIERSRPEAFLYPLIQSWPTPSPSAETLLVRRDGDDVLFLNDLRHRKDAALSLRVPVARTDVPATAGVLGAVGAFRGTDYRGVPVLSHLVPVPGTPWILVAKVDEDEILSEVRYRGGATLAIVLLGILLAAAVGQLVYRLWREDAVRREVLALNARREAEREARITLQSIGDGVIATDRDGRISRLNPVAVGLTGWDEESAVGRPIDDVFCIVNEESRQPVENPVAKVLAHGRVVGLANHTVLVARDGSERPIADSGAPIVDDAGVIRGAVLVFRDQTSERRHQAHLEGSEQRFRSLFETMFEGVALHELVRDPDGTPRDYRVLAANPSFGYHTGLDPETAAGRLATELYGSAEAPFLASYAEVVDTGKTARFLTFFEPLGRHYSITAFRPAPGQFATVFEDVTARIETETALRESERRMRRLYEESPMGYQSLDGEGRVLEVNPRWLDLLGYRRDEVLGRPFADFLAPDQVPLFRERFPRFLQAGSAADVEFRLVRKDGRPIDVSIDGHVSRRRDGTLRQTHCVLRDVTQQKAAEAERRLFEAAARQQQKLEAIGTLASGVAHEINNPLSIILNYAQLLVDGESEPARVRDYAGNIAQEGERMAVIVRNLLSFARQEKDTHSPARLVDVVEKTLSLVRAALRKDRILLEVEGPADLPPVPCRSQQIQQVLMNLLTNARDALNERHPGPSEDKVLRIVLSVVERDGRTWQRLTVEDRGIGVPAEASARVFDPFFTTKPRDKGTGLGLSISYGIVKEHGGDLWFESEPGAGAAFHVDLPMEERDEQRPDRG